MSEDNKSMLIVFGFIVVMVLVLSYFGQF